MRIFSGILFVLIAALPYAAMLRGGRPAEERAAAGAETLTILSPHRREVRLEYARGFREWMRLRDGRAVDVQWLDVGGTSKILKDVESRYATSPDAPGVDILFGGGVAPYITGIAQGWLVPVSLSPEAMAGIPDRVAGTPVYDPGRRWFGVALSSFGILYNRPLVERLGLPPPAGWDDLGRPEYRSWVASGDPRSSGSVHMCYEIILQAYGFERGWDLLTRICANVRGFGEGGGTAPREVASAEVAAGMVIDQYAQTVIDEIGSDQLVLVLPERMTMIGPDAIAVFRGGPRPELAQRFVEYVLSPEGQRILYQPAGRDGQRHALHRMPVRPALYDEPGAPRANPYRYAVGFRYDDALGNARWSVINDLVGVCLIDAHQDLARAWKRIIESGAAPGRVAELCAPPVPAERIPELIAAWKEPRRRMEITQRWAQEARARYARLAAE